MMMRDHVRDKSDTLFIISSWASIKQDGGHLGLGLHCAAVQIVAGSRADNRAGAEDDLAVQFQNHDKSTPTESAVGGVRD